MRCLALSLVLAACASSTPSLERKASRARAQGKTVIVEFYADWCNVCRNFRETVFPDPRVQAALTGVRYVRLDAEKGGLAEAKRLGVGSYPTFFALDPDGTPVAVLRGAVPVDYFVAFVEWGQVYAWDEAMVRQRLAAGRTVDALRLAARWYAEAGRVDEAVALFDEAIRAGAATDVVWERTQVRAAGGTRRAWAEESAGFLVEHPRDVHSIDALRIALLSGGFSGDEADALVGSYLKAVAEDASRLDQAVYVLLAAGTFERAREAAEMLVARWPKLTLFRKTLADARERKFSVPRARAHRDWVGQRVEDLRIK